VNTFEAVQIDNTDTIWVDKEGPLKNPKYFFKWQGYLGAVVCVRLKNSDGLFRQPVACFAMLSDNSQETCMKRILLATAFALGMATTAANAIILDDPLHIFCDTCSHVTIGGNDITILGGNNATNFSFTASPDSLSGNLQLKVLIPDTYAQSVVTAFGTANPTFALHAGIFDSGKLDEFLGFGASPTNPVDAFTGAASVLTGTTVDGFFVFTDDVGAFSAPKDGGVVTPSQFFSLADLPIGGLVAGNLFLANGDIVATANSSFGISNVPSPIVGAGIPGLVFALGGMLGLNRWRKRRT